MTTKQCTHCGSVLPLDEFYFVHQQRQPGKRRGECKTCVRDIKRSQRDGSWRPRCKLCRDELPDRRPGQQLCSLCHAEKYDQKERRPTRNSPRIILKPCTLCGGPKQRGASRRLCDDCRPFADQARRLREFGMSPADFKRLWEDQDGHCAICLEPQSDARRMAIDHDHSLPRGRASIRGLLCNACNYQRLPIFQERVDLLLSAVAYLKRGPVLDRYV